ncbi:hypothetical protein [Hymenobacter mucosus]|nr:hypothetical protein [Hymenobacter mucosus]
MKLLPQLLQSLLLRLKRQYQRQKLNPSQRHLSLHKQPLLWRHPL